MSSCCNKFLDKGFVMQLGVSTLCLWPMLSLLFAGLINCLLDYLLGIKYSSDPCTCRKICIAIHLSFTELKRCIAAERDELPCQNEQGLTGVS